MKYVNGEEYIVRYTNRENMPKYGSIYLVTPSIKDPGYLEVIDTLEGQTMHRVAMQNVRIISEADNCIEADMEFERYIKRLGS
jgi:hypothetical protein